MRWLVAFSVLVACSRPPAPPTATKAPELSLFFISELRGTIEPCGCTSDPLGDLARTAALVRGGPLFDGGSTLYSERPVSADKKAQEDAKARVLAQTLPKMGLWAAGLGPYDLGEGPDGILFPRQAANADGVATAPAFVRIVAGVKIGVFGVVDPALVPASDPVAAAAAAINDLRGQGAEIVVALAHMTRAAAKRLAQAAPGADFVLVGAGLDDVGSDVAEAVGGSYLVVPANRGQAVIRVALHYDGGNLVDAIGPARAAADAKKLEDRIAAIRTDLARWEKDPNADAAFVQQNRDEAARLAAERDALTKTPLRPPASGSWFTLARVPIKKGLPCDADVLATKRRYDAEVAELNRRASAEEKPPPVPPGKAGYVGGEECVYCHQPAVAFWKGTKHAKAWGTLAAGHKQWNRDCVGCHATGWLEPGGSVFATIDKLEDVQCEVCHGPGSLHVDADGKRADTLVRKPPASSCGRCHTPEHSDTFQYEAYLRDVVGPGHGAKLRAALGPGATGAELRGAALAKAGMGIGAGCER